MWQSRINARAKQKQDRPPVISTFRRVTDCLKIHASIQELAAGKNRPLFLLHGMLLFLQRLTAAAERQQALDSLEKVIARGHRHLWILPGATADKRAATVAKGRAGEITPCPPGWDSPDPPFLSTEKAYYNLLF
jgi:hypothetical protein